MVARAGPILRAAKSRLTATTWECLCECGNTINVRTNNLQRGIAKSCGCLKLPTLTGMRFGRLVVTSSVIRRKMGNGRWQCYWDCLCDCGTVKRVQSGNLRKGSTKSCGCLRREMLPSTKYLPGHSFVLKDYKRSASVRNLVWGLADEHAKSLFNGDCYYCGRPPTRITTPPDRAVAVDYAYNGIDRIDSTRGYLPDNVVTACTRCNYAKRNYSRSEFLEMVQLIYRKHFITKSV